MKEFRLQDRTQSEVSAFVQLTPQTDVRGVLQYIGSTDKFRWLGLGERIASFLLLLIKTISMAIGGSNSLPARKIRGISIGVRETELGIRLDSYFAVYGEVVYNFATGRLYIESPLAIVTNQ